MSSEVKNQSTSYLHHQAPNAKTILITNNYTQNGGIVGRTTTTTTSNSVTNGVNVGGVGNASATNSITILTSGDGAERVVEPGSSTVVLDRINICINNHYDSAGVVGPGSVVKIKTEKMGEIEEERERYGMMPPASVSSFKYKQGEDVLVLQKDGRFYLGTVVLAATNQCLVQFDDNTQKWASHNELKRFGTNKVEDDAPLCVVCKVKEEKQEVEVCERCGRGYHLDCTQGNFGANGVWYCRRCSAQNGTKTCNINQINETRPVKTCKSELSYDLDALQWDPYHRKNSEDLYCYCGTNGDWVEQMLQCSRCQQWFHDKCIQSLSYPLFSGDRFYIFVCSMCNFGNEFLRRLEINWTDLIHLLLFNLSFYNRPIKHFDLSSVLTPYFMELNKVLQLPDYMNGLAQLAIQQKFLIVLQSNAARFSQSSIDLKSWGLCQFKPPEAPFVILPHDGQPISESYICSVWADTKLPLGFVRHRDISNKKKSKVFGQNLQDWYKQIQGKQFIATSSRFENHQNYQMEANNEGFDEDDEIPVKFIIEKDKIGKFSGCKTVATPSTSSACSSVTIKNTDSNENSRDAFDDTSRDSIILPQKPAPQSKRRLRKRSMPNVCHEPPTKKNKHEKLSIPSPEDSSNDDDTSSRSTLDLIIPPPKDFQGSNNPFNPVYVPQTTLVTPVGKAEMEKDVMTGIDNKKSGAKRLTKIKGASKPPPESSKIRIVRTIRRRLSAKDIIIGPNQEVKYKKKSRHRNEDVEVISTTTINASSNVGTFLPIRTEFKDWNATPNTKLALFTSSSSSSSSSIQPPTASTSSTSLKRNRSFKDKSPHDRHSTGSSSGYSSTATSVTNTSHVGYSSLPSSPNAKDRSSFLGDINSSVSNYFECGGNNVKNEGEKYVIRGRRIRPDGTKQYLIEWNGKNKLQLF